MRKELYLNKIKLQGVKKPLEVWTDSKNIEIEKPIEVSKDAEFFPTPKEIVLDINDNLRLFDGCKILEPSAGTGNLILGLDSNIKFELHYIERNRNLFNICSDKILNETKIFKSVGICGDFLDEPLANDFDFIVMNPPFSKARKHIQKALDHLKKEGELLAVVPSTFKIDGMIEINFYDSKMFLNTKVSTKLIFIKKRDLI